MKTQTLMGNCGEKIKQSMKQNDVNIIMKG